MSDTPKDKPVPRGEVKRFYRINCGICGGVTEMADISDQGAFEKFCENGWRATENWGMIHQKCSKYLPALKL